MAGDVALPLATKPRTSCVKPPPPPWHTDRAPKPPETQKPGTRRAKQGTEPGSPWTPPYPGHFRGELRPGNGRVVRD